MRGKVAALALAAGLAGCSGGEPKPQAQAGSVPRAAPGPWQALSMAHGLGVAGEVSAARRMLGIIAALQPDDARVVLRHALSWLPDDPETTFELIDEALAVLRHDQIDATAAYTLRGVHTLFGGATPLAEAIAFVREGPLALGGAEALAVLALLEKLHPGSPEIAALRDEAHRAAEDLHARWMASRAL